MFLCCSSVNTLMNCDQITTKLACNSKQYSFNTWHVKESVDEPEAHVNTLRILLCNAASTLLLANSSQAAHKQFCLEIQHYKTQQELAINRSSVIIESYSSVNLKKIECLSYYK